jgi:hypothetical protein
MWGVENMSNLLHAHASGVLDGTVFILRHLLVRQYKKSTTQGTNTVSVVQQTRAQQAMAARGLTWTTPFHNEFCTLGGSDAA